ncbi:MAG: XisH protein [Chthonomonadaceae bacterium]|nr:XisH protein [Chthonomonadaceae bacterium]
MYVDLGAERLLAAERGTEKIAVEIKSFVGTSTLTELHNALGQYQVYLAVLEKIEPDRRLYLALSKTAFDELSEMETFQLVVTRFGIALLVVRIVEEEVAQWKT